MFAPLWTSLSVRALSNNNNGQRVITACSVKGERSQCECAEMRGCSLTHKVDDIVYVSLICVADWSVTFI